MNNARRATAMAAEPRVDLPPMYTTDLLHRVSESLVRIESGGRLAELQQEIDRTFRGIEDDLDCWPAFRRVVEDVARLASQITGLPLGDCRDAVSQIILPTTRQRLALEVVGEFDPYFFALLGEEKNK